MNVEVYGIHHSVGRHVAPRWMRHLTRRQAMWLCALMAWIVGALSAFIYFHAGGVQADDIGQRVQGAVLCTGWFGVTAFTAMPICRALMDEMWSRRLGLALGLLLALMFVGITINLAQYTLCDGGTWEEPVLGAWSDAEREYRIALCSALGEPLPHSNAYGYPLFVGVLMRLFGPSVLVPLLVNAVCIFAAAAVTGAVSVALLPHLNRRKTALWSAVMFALIPSMPYYGTMLMKEAPVILSFALTTLMIADIYVGRFRVRSAVAGAIGASGLMLFKSPLGWMLMVGAVIALWHQWTVNRRLTGSMRAGTLCALLLCLAVLAGGRAYRPISDFSLVQRTQGEANNGTMLGYGTTQKYATLVDDYYDTGVGARLTRLPLACAAQWMPPFPWNWTRDAALGPFVWWAHLAFLWYIVGGVCLGYFALCCWRSRTSGGLPLWGLWWVICYVAVAYASAGSVARYILPFIPLLIPLGLQTAATVRHGLINRRAARVYGGCYTVAICVALILAYNFLKG